MNSHTATGERLLALKISARRQRCIATLGLIAIAITLHGCSTNVIIVQGEFPTPLVDALPVTLGIHYTEDFANHKYEYQPKGMTEIKLVMDTGGVQTQMFNNLLPHMFEDVVMLDTYPPEPDSGIDLVLIPEVDDFQHAIPSHTKINVFEIWIRYRMQLFDAAGDPVADWIMSSYGKTPTAFMQSNDAGINSAAIVALRDAGANFALNFARVPEVKLWLEERADTDGVGDSP